MLVLAADSNLLSLLLDFGEEALDTLVLHRILDGAMGHAFIKAVANLRAADLLDQRVAELFVD